MPLVDISASEATQNRKNNGLAGWGDRLNGNRIEPIARPGFDAPFQLEPGEPVFTVGSFFARNIDAELRRRGFQTPVLEHLEQPALHEVGGQAINCFGAPSIYNEFAWAFGERPFDLTDHVVELSAGRFADLHMPPGIRGAPMAVLGARRKAIQALYRSVKDCRVVIMTLGLSEVWFDTRAQSYVNLMPRASALRREPDRFRLHVLSFSETYDYLDRALRLILRHGRPDVRVILTVSPAPLLATYRKQDVIVANTYSKSVLRAAAEAAVCEHEFVTYFPSYETCVLSDRKYAWEPDLVSVTQPAMTFNVRRLLDRYCGPEWHGDGYEADIAAGGAPAAAEWASRMRRAPLVEGSAFFGRYAAFGAESPQFALEHARFLNEIGDWAASLEVLDAALSADSEEVDSLELAIFKAEMLCRLRRPQQAIELLDRYAVERQTFGPLWQALLTSAMATGQRPRVLDALTRCIAAQPGQTAIRRAVAGKWFLQRGDFAGAAEQLEAALAFDASCSIALLHYAEFLVRTDNPKAARMCLEGFAPTNPGEESLLRSLNESLAATAPAR